ncbi:MAG: SDR family oxidoreductase [Clostridia bacterium]|nr:SDR family oxidoreductase [Clostridia bacterium]
MKKTAIIIGASGEIGLETAKKMAKEGYYLALTYNKNKVDFKNEIDCDNVEIKAYPLDLKSDDIAKTFMQIGSDFKYIDTLVFCSGIAQKRALIFDVSDEEIDNLFEVNIKSAIKCIKAFSKMTAGKHPANIVLVSSFVEKMGCSCESVYAATKSAMNGLCRSLASELGNLGIRINVVAPGFIDTKMNVNLTDEEKTEIADMTPLQTLGNVCDVANAIVFLSSEKASFITGQILYVDGGLILE